MSVSYETFAKTKISAFQCPNGTAYISHIRHARSPQRLDHAKIQSQFRLGFAHPTRTISAEDWPRKPRNTVSPRFRASEPHDLRRGLTTHPHNRSFAWVSRIRHARSPQMIDHANRVTQFRLGFAHPNRAISAEGWPRTRAIAVSPGFRASDTHDLRRGLTTQRYNRSSPRFRASDTNDLRRGLTTQRYNRSFA